MSKVDDFFITPLEAHFEAQPTEGGRDTILNDLADYTPEDLNRAVEWLKRARQSVKTFPSPKECIKAIRTVVSARVAYSHTDLGTITAANYAAKAAEFGAGMTKLPIIKRDMPQWDEWQEYWRWLGCRSQLNWTRDRDSWTVPTIYPNQFDPRFSVQANQPSPKVPARAFYYQDA